MVESVKIIGIDPGLRRCGWGVVESLGNRLMFVASGAITPPTTGSMPQRLVFLAEALRAIIEKYQPDEAAVEETFVNAGARSALMLGQARGVILLVPATLGLHVGEYAPNLIKKSVVGSGHADKNQIQLMVKVLLPQADFASADAADALAIAICHAHHRTSLTLRSAHG